MERQTEQSRLAIAHNSQAQEDRACGAGQVGDDDDIPAFFQNEKTIGFTGWRRQANRLRETQPREGVGQRVTEPRRRRRQLQRDVCHARTER